MNHTQKLDDSWSAFLNAGYAKYNEYKEDPNTGSLTLNNDGLITGVFRSRRSESTITNWQIGVRNEKDFGNNIKNDLSLAVDWYSYKTRYVAVGNVTGQATIVGDIWNGIQIVGDRIYAGPISDASYSKETAYGVTLADRVELGKFSVYGAVQYKDTEVGSTTGYTFSKDSLNPTFALAYKPNDTVSVYASYAISYTKPIEVDASYINAGEIFKPIKNKQTEIGVKYENSGLLYSLAFFDLNQGNYITEDAGNGNLYYSQQGENRFKGIEYSVAGKIAPKWNVMGGVMYLNGKREKLSSGSEHLEGRYALGTPRWHAVLAAEYEPNEDNAVILRMNYMGEAYVNDNGVKVPDYMTVDLGYRHKTKLSGVPVTLHAMCYNVLGKDYWLTRYNGISLGAPRTFMVSATFDLF